jgi:hypothetical protein
MGFPFELSGVPMKSSHCKQNVCLEFWWLWLKPFFIGCADKGWGRQEEISKISLYSSNIKFKWACPPSEFCTWSSYCWCPSAQCFIH